MKFGSNKSQGTTTLDSNFSKNNFLLSLFLNQEDCKGRGLTDGSEDEGELAFSTLFLLDKSFRVAAV